MPTLNWIGKDKVVSHHQDVPYRVLEHKYGFTADPSTGSGQEQTEPTNSGNKIIQGDNLEALKSLLPEYEGKINCIYIDPPYNTGNEKWVYNDNVNHPKIKKWLGEVVGKDGDDLTRHDKWLCMMYPRLKMLHKLLADDGAIFISIDDNEQANLKLMCDEIFGAFNHVATLTWFKKVSPSNDATWFSSDTEYISVFAKRKKIWRPNRLPLNEKQRKYYRNPDNDERGVWNSSTYTCNKTVDERPNLYYPLVNPTTKEEIWPKKTAVWAYSEEQSKTHIKENLIYWGKDGKAKMPRFKKFIDNHKGVVPRTIWHYDDFGHTQEATKSLREVLGNVFFSTPKPPRLIEAILKIACDKNSIILDSFAGSGTTAHAVLNLNKQDGGNRKFILVEMEDYANDITAERVKRVTKGYGVGAKAVAGTGGAFDFYELGLPLFDENQNLNEQVGLAKIREYIWFSETRSSIYDFGFQIDDLQDLRFEIDDLGLNNQKSKITNHKYYLGKKDGTVYYFIYEKNKLTTLDYDSLELIKTKGEQYVIYADNCLLPKDFMAKKNIIFKKIPRDITRF